MLIALHSTRNLVPNTAQLAPFILHSAGADPCMAKTRGKHCLKRQGSLETIQTGSATFVAGSCGSAERTFPATGRKVCSSLALVANYSLAPSINACAGASFYIVRHETFPSDRIDCNALGMCLCRHISAIELHRTGANTFKAGAIIVYGAVCSFEFCAKSALISPRTISVTGSCKRSARCSKSKTHKPMRMSVSSQPVCCLSYCLTGTAKRLEVRRQSAAVQPVITAESEASADRPDDRGRPRERAKSCARCFPPVSRSFQHFSGQIFRPPSTPPSGCGHAYSGPVDGRRRSPEASPARCGEIGPANDTEGWSCHQPALNCRLQRITDPKNQPAQLNSASLTNLIADQCDQQPNVEFCCSAGYGMLR